MAEQQNAKDLRGLPEAELRTKIDEIRQEMWQHRVKAKSGSFLQVHQIGALRRQIARIETVIRQQQSKADGAKS